MHMKEIMDLLVERAKEPRTAGEMVLPSSELIAFNVRCTRTLMQLKVSALAAMAGVSVSTVERVERAERVSNELLDRIAIALGYQPGDFWKPRPLKSQDEVQEEAAQWANMRTIRLEPFKKEHQVRQLARCHGFVLSRPYLGPEFDDDLNNLVEWIDLTGMVLGDPHPSEDVSRRELYASVLGAVDALERRGVTVLVGVMENEDADGAWRTSVISVTPKDRDPGAIKGRSVLVDSELSIGARIAPKGRH
jgi:transcriptional regulator with XRE-family HTH domain